MGPIAPSTPSIPKARDDSPERPETPDELARQLIQNALAAPTDHLSEGGSWHSYVPFAHALIAVFRPTKVVELGVHKGDSYLTFCRALLDHGIEGVAIGIDSWQGDSFTGRCDGDETLQALKEKHDPLVGDVSTLLRKTFDDALEDVEDGSVDLLHIDGFHSYEAVRHDFETWEPKLSKRGIVLFHYTNIREEGFGVWKFWPEVSQGRESYEFLYGNGLGVLIVGDEVDQATHDLIDLLRDDNLHLGFSTREVLERIGRGVADKNRAASLNSEVDRTNQSWADERIITKAEFDRLRDEIEKERKVAQAEFDRLRGELSKERNIAKANLEKLSSAKPKQRIRPIFSMIMHSVRIGGRVVIDRLPVSHGTKLRIKYAILSVAGPLFGVARGSAGPSPDSSTVGKSQLRITNERYRELAATARGTLSSAPQRSVSIVVPVYNQLNYTLDCIDAIKENTSDIDHEIIIVDDCSTDDTQATLSARDDIVYLRNETNLGFIGSCNAGASRAGKTYVCFLNNDTTVLPYWLSALVNTFELHENVGLAGSKLIYPDGRLQEAGGLVWSDGSAWNWGRLQNPNNPGYGYARHVDYCSGASILVPRALFTSLGGFDAHYAPAYGEDSDLAFKIRSLGLATIYQPLSHVIHFEGVTSGTDTSQGVKKHQVANAEKLAKRWAPVFVHQGQSEYADTLSDRGVAGHILVLDQITPEPDRDAGSITALELMRTLRDLGHKIAFAPCSNLCDIPPYSDLLSALGFESMLIPWTTSVKQHLLRCGQRYDAVLIFRPRTWRDHIGDIRKYAPNAKVIYHASDLHYLRHRRGEDVSGPSKESAAANADAAKNAELDLISSNDLCILHSTVEKKLVEEERPGSRVVCFPWIYEPRGRGRSMEERSGIVFVGGYRHPPNVDAVEHYIEDIHPLVKGQLTRTVMFTAAGSSPPDSMTALAGPDISIPGYVEDIAPVLFEARVMVAPLRYGAGIKGKILSAMAHGMPVVTTTIGAEGMGLIDGESVLIADDPKEFAAAVCRLYEDSDLWHRLQEAGLAYIRENTSRDVGLKIVAGALRQLDIPFIERQAPSSDDDGGASSGFGSRLEVTDIEALAKAGKRMLPGAESVDLVVAPNAADVLATESQPLGIGAIASYSELSKRLPAAKTVLAIADPTDAESIDQLSQALRDHLSHSASCVVVIAPPRMVAGVEGYTMMAPFVDREVSEIALPFHETLAEHFQFEGRDCKWLIDKSLTGFPAVTILRISK